jgi:site-specific recombinase XerD
VKWHGFFSGYVFTTERGTPFTPDAINRPVKIIGKRAGISFPVHFHMLRHSCGYKLANDGMDTRAIQDWLGHVSITHTTRYTALSPSRFKDFWRDLSFQRSGSRAAVDIPTIGRLSAALLPHCRPAR